MKFTLKWLKSHLKTDATLEEIINKLNQIGLEVEKVIDNKQIYGEFLVAQILRAIPHPNADKLRVCEVDNGQEILQIVCGASNARAGITVVLAPIGSVIPANGMVLGKSAIRGVESYGMLCSASELAIGQDSDNIIELPDGKAGYSFAKYYGLDDIIIELSLTPDRGDCASVLGVARDLAATGIGNLVINYTRKAIHTNGRLNNKVSVKLVETELCSEFCYIYGEKLNNSGIVNDARLKNIKYDLKSPLIDISNFMMLDLGRPNHIYDADKISGEIVVRKSFFGEKFKAIGGTEYTLPEGLLVVADQEKILSLAGIIGGEDSKVTAETANILIEVADFDAEAIIKAGRALNIITDARFRFERHIDFSNTQSFISNMISLIEDYCGGNFSEANILKGKNKKPIGLLDFDPSTVSKIAGVTILETEVYEILKRLGFTRYGMKIQIPSWRIFDITNGLDLVGEVLRIYGLTNVESQDLPYNFAAANVNAQRLERVQNRLLCKNMTEVISWSFISEKVAGHFAEKDDLLLVQNPISADMAVMRPSILCSFIQIVNKNVARKNDDLNIFELGPVYSKRFDIYQTQVIAGLRCGNIIEKNVHGTARLVDFFDIKDDVLAVLSEFSIEIRKYIVTRDVPSYYHPTRSACLKLGENKVAFFGELHPKVVADLKVAQKKLLCFEIFLENIPQSKVNYNKAKASIFDYQSVNRDFAFLISNEISGGDLVKAIESLKIEVIEEIKLFDIYEGKGVEPGFKSAGLSIKIQPRVATMTEQEIDSISQQIVNKLGKKFNASLRE